jgi:hypothetical protein
MVVDGAAGTVKVRTVEVALVNVGAVVAAGTEEMVGVVEVLHARGGATVNVIVVPETSEPLGKPAGSVTVIGLIAVVADAGRVTAGVFEETLNH